MKTAYAKFTIRGNRWWSEIDIFEEVEILGKTRKECNVSTSKHPRYEVIDFYLVETKEDGMREEIPAYRLFS